LVATGGDCKASASVAKPNEEKSKRLPHNFARNDDAVESAVLSGKSDYCGTTNLQLLQAVVALTEESNLNVDVAGKTPLSDWRRIDR
jgi:hypothetical protein